MTALLYSVLYGPGDNDAPRKAKFSEESDAVEFAREKSFSYANVSIWDKKSPLTAWRNGDIVR